ncbi:ATP-binding cassette domain-containing protein, partial [Thioclava sp. BHET1]
MNEVMLRLSGGEKSYNRGKPSEVKVLRGVDLEIRRGEVVAMVAPSGAGKSTLLHIAGLLDTPDTGSVEIGGTEMTRLGDRARTVARRQDVGFIYQFHHLLPEFTAIENIVLPQLANGTSRPVAEGHATAFLERVGVAPRAA